MATSQTPRLRTKASVIHRSRDRIEEMIHHPPDLQIGALRQLRYEVFVSGVTSDKLGHCHYRSYLWTILLQVPMDRTKHYVRLVMKGASKADTKIRSDTFRTMQGDKAFKLKVPEYALLRVLNAYVWDTSSPYVQGMNVLVAPFLYVCRSESQAYLLFNRFIRGQCPLYVTSDLSGVNTGVKLVNLLLELIDRRLYLHLKSKVLTAEIWAFASVLTFSACTPPLAELLRLWDLYLAYGVHLNIVAVVAQVVGIRDQLLATQQPVTLLRKMPSLCANEIKMTMVTLLPKIPESLWDLIRRHTYDPDVRLEATAYMQSRRV